jgi:hypothetical protein
MSACGQLRHYIKLPQLYVFAGRHTPDCNPGCNRHGFVPAFCPGTQWDAEYWRAIYKARGCCTMWLKDPMVDAEKLSGWLKGALVDATQPHG